MVRLHLSPLRTFLLTRPSRDVTISFSTLFRRNGISTHTPLAGRDVKAAGCDFAILRFLLTRPSRDVTCSSVIIALMLSFLLTRPSRDVTHYKSFTALTRKISTHTPLAGRDLLCASGFSGEHDFYSHAPRGT